jgi:hypothetical protein
MVYARLYEADSGKKQISCEDDRKKGKSNDQCRDLSTARVALRSR